MEINDRRYVPLQWAESLEQMQGMSLHTVANDKVHLIGFSMGGYIATQFALAHPEQVASLTLIGYSPAGLSKAEIQQRKQIVAALGKGRFKPMSNARLAQLIWQHGPHAELAMSINREMEQDLGGAVLKYHMQATSERPDYVSGLASAPFPIHIVAAKHDQIAPSLQLKEISQQISASAFFEIADSGHLSPLEQTEQLARVLTQLLTLPSHQKT